MSGKVKSALILITSLVVVACGGGGSGGGGGDTPTLSPLSITTANAPAVSGEVVNATDAVEGFGGGSSGTILAAVTTTGGDRQSLVDVIRSQLDRFPLLQNAASNAVVGAVVGPTTFACAVSGTTTVSGNLADPASLSAGDSLSATFSSCDEGNGSILGGGLSMPESLRGGLPDELVARQSGQGLSLEVRAGAPRHGLLESLTGLVALAQHHEQPAASKLSLGGGVLREKLVRFFEGVLCLALLQLLGSLLDGLGNVLGVGPDDGG